VAMVALGRGVVSPNLCFAPENNLTNHFSSYHFAICIVLKAAAPQNPPPKKKLWLTTCLLFFI